MLPFLAYPKRFTDHFYTRSELAYLRRKQHTHQRRWVYGFDFVVLVIGLVFVLGFVKDLWQLVLLGILVATAHLVLHVRTLIYACDVMTRDRQAITWDNLILTRLDAQGIIVGKWWALLRYLWREYALGTALRLIMALALSQYLFYIPALQCPKILGALCYVDAAPTPLYYSPNQFPYRPNWYDWNRNYALPQYYANLETIPKIAVASVVLIAFSILEAGLMAALGLVTSLLFSTRLNVLIAIAMRLSLAALAAVAVGGAAFYRESNIKGNTPWGGISPTTQYSYANKLCYDKCVQVQTSEAFQIIVSSVVEDGLSIASNLLRPKLLMSRTLYLLRNLNWAVAGLGIYTFLLWLCLRVAILTARRHGAATGY